MKPPPRPGALLVATRELRWMRRDGLALFLVIGVPLIAFALLAWTFSSAVIRDLRVTIVDGDRTPASMNYVQALASSPGLRVDRRSGDLTDAMHAVRSGDALGAVYIPENFERDLMGRKRPQIVMFYNRQYFTPGNNASSAMSSAIAAATAGLPSPTQQAKTPATTGSLVVEQYVLTNPALNFAQFLMRAILPTTLHIVIAIAAGYAVGSEFSSRNSAAWLRAAGGSPLAALVGKLAPLFAMFVVMLVVEAGIVHGVFHVPFRGDSVIAGAGGCLLVIGYLSMGALFQLLIRKLAVGLSVTAIFCSPAFGFAGVGFPLLAMNGFSHFWGALLPLRWYIQILFDQAVRGLPPIVSVEPLVVLAVLAAVLFALSWWRLSAIAHTPPRRVPRPEPVPEAPASAGIGAAMFAEIRRVLHDQSALGLIVLAPLLYGALYPQPYLGQLLRDLPIAVVDQDNTEVSRQFVQALNSDEAISVAVRAGSLAEAQAALATRQVFGIVEVPAGTEREILKGNQARIAAYVDSAYFLLYSRTWQGIADSAAAANEAIAAHGARLDGSLAHAALIGISAVEAVSEPLFNPTGAYASYVVPAAFILILQQSLLMGTATLGGVAFEQGGLAARRQRGSLRSVIGQGLAHLCLEVPGLALYLIVLPRVYGFSTLGGVLDLVLMAIPFVLSVSFLAQFVSFWFKRRETAVLLFIASSLPLFFMVGVAWPVEAIPGTIRTLSRLFPSTSAIDGLVRINQMGASLRDVSREWLTLWVLAVVYATLAALASWVAKRREGAVVPDRKTYLPALLLAIAGWCGLIPAPPAAARQDAPPLAGVVRETEVRISPEQNGRLAVIHVVAGQQVKRGDLLAELSNPDLAASVAEANAAALQARTNRDNVLAGVRKEEVHISTENVRIAEANVLLAKQQYARTSELAGRNFASRQQLDEAASSLSKAEASLAEMQAIQHRNEAGPTAEERMIAEAKLTLATAHAADLEAKLAKTRIISPIDATVGLVVASTGEIISPGQAILTLEVPRQRWFSFTIREDSLGGLTIGSFATVVTAKGQHIPGQATELRPLGEFATWRAARAVGDHDLNSFLLRIDPSGVADGIEPGMTVWLDSAAPASK